MAENQLPPELSRQFVLITDESRFKRKKALEKIKEETVDRLGDFEEKFSHDLLLSTSPNLVTALFDSIEKHRETTISIFQGLIGAVSNINECLPVIVPALAKRLGQKEITENSEELRLELVSLTLSIIKKAEKQNAAYLDEYIHIFVQTLVDPYPAVRRKTCLCARALAKVIPQYFSMQSETLIKPLIHSISHQHSKVRSDIIYAIGDVIQYGNGKSVTDVTTHLAQRLFDPAPIVRKAVIEIVGMWLLDLMDRYSFHHSLIPLLLSGYTDEIEEICNLTNDLWYDIGMKYEKENEDDLKDKLDFEKPPLSHYPEDTERPNMGCRVLIFRTLSRILPALVRDTADWVVGTRVKAAQLLPHLLINAEDCLTQHAELLLSGISRGLTDVEVEVRKPLERAAYLTGFFIEPMVWWNLVGVALRRGDTGSSLLAGQLTCLAGLIGGSDASLLVDSGVANKIARQLTEEELAHSLVAEVKWQMLSVLDRFMQLLKERHGATLVTETQNLFYSTLSVLAVMDPRQDAAVTKAIVAKARLVLASLATLTGLDGTEQLYEQCLPVLLTSLRSECDHWIPQSANRYILDALLLESGPVVGRHISHIMPIFEICLDSNKEPELRLKFFMLLARLVINSTDSIDSHGEFYKYLSPVLRELILPNCVWRAGRTCEAVRKISATCLHPVLLASSRPILTQTESSLSQLEPALLLEMITRLMSLIEDDLRDTRLLACSCLQLVLIACTPQLAQDTLDRDPLHQIYPSLLKRMDDASDEVRIRVTEVMQAWFDLLGPGFDIRLYTAHLEDFYSGMLIHLDDPEPSVQQAVLGVLLKAGRLDPDLLNRAVVKARERHRSPHLCDQLLAGVKTSE